MSKYVFDLRPQTPTRQVQVGFTPVAAAIMNNSAYGLLIRRGTQELPTFDSYDYYVPSGQYTTLPVWDHEYGFALDILAGITPVYSQPCFVFLLDALETLPDFGSSSYRLSTRLDHSVVTGDHSSDVFDCRASRGLLLSIRNKNAYVVSASHAVSGVVEVYTANSPAEFGTTDAKLTRTIPLPLSVESIEAVVPLAASFVEIRVVNYYGVQNPLHVIMDVALTDEVPGTIPRRVTEFVSPFVNAPIVGLMTLLNEHIQAHIPYIDVLVTPTAPTAAFSFHLNVIQIEGLNAVGESWHFSSVGNMTGLTGGGRQGIYLRSFDPANGKRLWRVPTTMRVDRFFQIQLDIFSVPQQIALRVPFEMEI